MIDSLQFYERLGGRVTIEYLDGDGSPTYVRMRVGMAHIGLRLSGFVKPGDSLRAVPLWVYADDCCAAVESLRVCGVPVVEEPSDQVWGERIARVLDPDGNEVVIGQRLR